jgi:hypothetical protein
MDLGEAPFKLRPLSPRRLKTSVDLIDEREQRTGG